MLLLLLFFFSIFLLLVSFVDFFSAVAVFDTNNLFKLEAIILSGEKYDEEREEVDDEVDDSC